MSDLSRIKVSNLDTFNTAHTSFSDQVVNDVNTKNDTIYQHLVPFIHHPFSSQFDSINGTFPNLSMCTTPSVSPYRAQPKSKLS